MTEAQGSVTGDILLVDDNPDNLKLLARILTEDSFRIRASDSGRYALKSIKHDPPDLILLDVRMPGMDGYEVCRRLKADPLHADIPVIFISALREEESKVKSFDLGGVDYITKPFQPQEILARVRTHLSMSRMQRHLEDMVQERTSKLQAAREHFQRLFELASDAFFIHDMDGTIIDVNQQACTSLRYTREEVLQLKASDIETAVSHEQIRDIANRVDRGQHVLSEAIHRRKDGSTFPVEVNMGLFQEEEPKLFLTIARDISERKLAEQQLLENQAQLKSLASELVLAEERERNRIAVHLHDDVCQNLAYSKMKVQILREALKDQVLLNDMTEVSDTLTQMMQDVQTLTFELSSPVLTELGLEAAVSDWLTGQVEQKYGISATLTDDGQVKPLEKDIQALLFRSIRELLVNTAKHSQANNIQVDMSREENQIVICLEDDGIGFCPEQVVIGKDAGGFGLFSIRERLSHMGGILEIDSSPGHGCKSILRAPLIQGPI